MAPPLWRSENWRKNTNSSVIRQKGESQNECFKKAKHAKILACFAFLKHSFWDSPLCLITDEFWKVLNLFWRRIQNSFIYVRVKNLMMQYKFSPRSKILSIYEEKKRVHNGRIINIKYGIFTLLVFLSFRGCKSGKRKNSYNTGMLYMYLTNNIYPTKAAAKKEDD